MKPARETFHGETDQLASTSRKLGVIEEVLVGVGIDLDRLGHSDCSREARKVARHLLAVAFREDRAPLTVGKPHPTTHRVDFVEAEVAAFLVATRMVKSRNTADALGERHSRAILPTFMG